MNLDPELIPWLRSKLSEAEKAVRAREQARESWSSGTNKEWEASAKLHPDTANKPPIKRAERMAISAAQGRIAEKCRRDVVMFKATIATLRAMQIGG